MKRFTITFNSKIKNEQKENILDLLEINLRGSLYKSIERIGNEKLVVEGDFYSFAPSRNVPWNLWTGFSKRTEIEIKENEIYYRLDYTYAIISLLYSSVSIIIFLTIALFILDFNLSFIFYCFLVLFALLIFGLGYGIFQHRKLFINTLKYGSRFKGTYDWGRILKTKSLTELENIASGKTALTEEVQELAKKELASRQK